jgi:hypothetical protein
VLVAEKEELLISLLAKSSLSYSLSRATDGFQGFKPVSLKACLKVYNLKVFRHISKRVDKNSTFVNFLQPICVASLIASLCQCL